MLPAGQGGGMEMSSSESRKPGLGTRVGTQVVVLVVMALVIGAIVWAVMTPDGKRLMDSVVQGLSDLMSGTSRR